MDITQLILDDHHEQRRRFANLEQIDSADVRSLGEIWDRLAVFLAGDDAGAKAAVARLIKEIGSIRH